MEVPEVLKAVNHEYVFQKLIRKVCDHYIRDRDETKKTVVCYS